MLSTHFPTVSSLLIVAQRGKKRGGDRHPTQRRPIVISHAPSQEAKHRPFISFLLLDLLSNTVGLCSRSSQGLYPPICGQYFVTVYSKVTAPRGRVRVSFSYFHVRNDGAFGCEYSPLIVCSKLPSKRTFLYHCYGPAIHLLVERKALVLFQYKVGKKYRIITSISLQHNLYLHHVFFDQSISP